MCGCSVSKLSDLPLHPEDYDALCRQGFVSCEVRNNGKYFKLRYRISGDQKVLGLGRNEQSAARIRSELEALQRRHHDQKQLQKLTRQANALLRTAKNALFEKIAEWGFEFHGHEIRLRRAGNTRLSCAVPGEPIESVKQTGDQRVREQQNEQGRY